MPSQIIQMAAAGTGGTENAAATIDVPQDGSILGVEWSVHCDFDAIGEDMFSVLSFIATNQFGVNNSFGEISYATAGADALTSGGFASTANKHTTFVDLRVAAGERLHLHLLSTAGVTSLVICMIEFLFGSVSRRASRRR